jgi:hypothetical protein
LRVVGGPGSAVKPGGASAGGANRCRAVVLRSPDPGRGLLVRPMPRFWSSESAWGSEAQGRDAGCRMLVMIIMMMRMSKKDQWMRRIGRSVGEFPGCVGAQQAAVMLSGIHGAERGTAQRLTPTVGAVSPCELLGWCPAFPERHDWHFPCHARASPNELKLGFVGEHDEIS